MAEQYFLIRPANGGDPITVVGARAAETISRCLRDDHGVLTDTFPQGECFTMRQVGRGINQLLGNAAAAAHNGESP